MGEPGYERFTELAVRMLQRATFANAEFLWEDEKVFMPVVVAAAVRNSGPVLRYVTYLTELHPEELDPAMGQVIDVFFDQGLADLFLTTYDGEDAGLYQQYLASYEDRLATKGRLSPAAYFTIARMPVEGAGELLAGMVEPRLEWSTQPGRHAGVEPELIRALVLNGSPAARAALEEIGDLLADDYPESTEEIEKLLATFE